MPLPGCMAPDGAEPCESYRNLRAAIEVAMNEIEHAYGHLPTTQFPGPPNTIIARLQSALQNN